MNGQWRRIGLLQQQGVPKVDISHCVSDGECYMEVKLDGETIGYDYAQNLDRAEKFCEHVLDHIAQQRGEPYAPIGSDGLIMRIAGEFGYTCWQDVIGDMEKRIEHPEHDLRDSLERFYRLLRDEHGG